MKKGPFFFLILCFVGLCAYLFTAFYDTAEKTAIRQLNDQQTIHAEQAAHGIEDFFATWTSILSSFAKMNEIIRVDDDGKRYMSLFHEAHQEQIRSITRVDENGLILYTAPASGSEGIDISGQRHMQEILRHHHPVASDVFKTVQGFDGVALHVPVFKGSTFKGTVAIVIDFTNLAERYLEVIRIGKTGYAWVVSRDGTTLYSPVPGFTGKSIFDNFKEYPGILAMTEEMLQGHQGTATYTFNKIGEATVAPTKKYAVYLPIPIANSFWSIVVASSEDEVLSSLSSFRNRLFLVIGLILFGGVLFSLLSAKAWLIVKEEEKRKIAEESLQQSQQYNRLLFELSPIGLALCRMDGTLVDINPAYAKIIGRSVEETLHLTYWDITPPKYAAQEQAQLKSLEGTGRYGPYEKEYLHQDGHLIPVRLQGLLIEKDGAKLIWSSVEDISDRKTAETALQRNEQVLRLFVEHSPAAIAMFDNEMLYVVASHRFRQDYGLGEQDIIGRSHYEVFPEVPERWQEIHRRCLAGAVEKCDDDSFPRPDGTMDWVRWEIRPWYEPQGEIGGIILFSEVITERKQAEIALRNSEARLARAEQIAHVGNWSYQVADASLQWSDELWQIFGRDPHSVTLTHDTFISWIRDDFRAYHDTVMAQLLALHPEETIKPLTYCLIRPDGEERFVEVLLDADFDDSGKPLRLFGTVQDITERKKTELELKQHREHLEELIAIRTAELQESETALMNLVEDLHESTEALARANNQLQEIDRLKSIFIASMSHELRTPLNSVIGFSSVLSNEWAGPVSEEQKNLLMTINRSGKHLLSLINDVIDISKIESGKLDIHREDFDLHEVITEAVESLAKNAADKKLALKAEIPHLLLHSDRRRLLQCILNLLSNALKFTLEGGVQITARTIEEGELIEISVEDTGIGIKEDDIPKLFHSFVRLDSPLRSTVLGTGLGLYLTKKLVKETLDGDISAASTDGVGSKFTLKIPALLNNPPKGDTRI